MERDAYGRILVVDDTNSIAIALKELLEVEGFMNVVALGSPGEALQEIKDNGSPAVVITDYKMPDMNGVELLDKITAKDPRTCGIIISCAPDDIEEPGPYPILNKVMNDNFMQSICSIVRMMFRMRGRGEM